MGNDFDKLLVLADQGLQRLRNRAVTYESRPTAKPEMLRDIKEEVSAFQLLMEHPVLSLARLVFRSIRHALTDTEVGVHHLSIRLRANKQQISRDSIDVSA